MTAQTIEWHKNCLGNIRSHLAREEAHRDRVIEACRKLVDSERQYTAQIAEAERRGKDKFDSDRFMGGRVLDGQEPK